MSRPKNKKIVDSAIAVHETEESKEKTLADLKIKDPKPELAKAILDERVKDESHE